MKLKSIILLLFFILPTIKTIAQDDIYDSIPINYEQLQRKEDRLKRRKERKEKHKKYPKKINSGFIFIDGKYIEPPYKFKIKKGEIYVNDKAIEKQNYYKKIKKVRKLPEVPASLNDSSTIDKLLTVRTKDGKLFFSQIIQYFADHYNLENARLKEIEYINNLINIESYDGHYLIAKNGEQLNITILRMKKQKKIRNRVKKKHAKNRLKYIIDKLKNNDVIIRKIFTYSYDDYGMSFNDLKTIINLLDSSNNYIIDSIIPSFQKKYYYDLFKKKNTPFIDSLRKDKNLQKIKNRVNSMQIKAENIYNTKNKKVIDYRIKTYSNYEFYSKYSDISISNSSYTTTEQTTKSFFIPQFVLI